MSFNQLSNEILIEVVKYLGLRPNRNLARCSKRLNELSTPYLYEIYIQGNWYQDTSLVSTLLKKPELGTHIKSFAFGSSYYPESTQDRDLSSETLSLCREKMETICREGEVVEKWMTDLQEKNRSALVGLLLACMPNLEEINLVTYKSWSPIGRILQNAATLQSQGDTSPLAMLRLESVSAQCYGTECELSLAAILPFLLPRSVKMAEFFAVVDEVGLPDEPFDLTAETLLLNYSFIGGNALVSFLKCFKNLKKFLYSQVPDSYLPPQKAGEAIAHLKNCLEDLAIHNDDTEDDPDTFKDGDGTRVGSLKDFQKLHTISFTANVLFGPLGAEEGDELRPRLVDILPSSLKRLELFNYDPPIIEQILELLRRREEVVPKLEVIKLERRIEHSGQEGQPPNLEEAIERLTGVCKAADIRLLM